MKVIDLLNKIANIEEVPSKIKYGDDKYIWTGLNYYNKEKDEYLDNHIALEDLEYPIEIIEEDKIPEKIDLAWQNVFDEQAQQDCIKMISENINEIIDYLKSKGE